MFSVGDSRTCPYLPIMPPTDCDDHVQEDDLGGPAEEMRFALPAAPSPPVQEFLLAGVQEAARGGGYYLSTDALALFIWRLGDAALSTFR